MELLLMTAESLAVVRLLNDGHLEKHFQQVNRQK